MQFRVSSFVKLTYVGYVPYNLLTEADPRLSSLLQSALTSYRHELLLDNVSGIPLLLQHGSADDNVPVFHSRRMHQLLSQTKSDRSLVKYVELNGAGHWFDGIMTTPVLLQFYRELLDGHLSKKKSPQTFAIVVADPADMGSKYGLEVCQKSCPGQLGRLDVLTENCGLSWSLRTSNILSFHITTGSAPKTVIIDSQTIDLPLDTAKPNVTFSRSSNGSWMVCLRLTQMSIFHSLIALGLQQGRSAGYWTTLWSSAW